MPAMGQVCVIRARSLASIEDPELTFRPVLRWMELEPAALVRMEHLIATVRFAADTDRERAVAFLLAARELLQSIRMGLVEDDRESLRVHPWTTFIRRGVERAGGPARPRT